MNIKHRYSVRWSEDDQEYVGLCNNFSSLSWIADSQKEALNGIKKLVANVIKDMEGEEIVRDKDYFLSLQK